MKGNEPAFPRASMQMDGGEMQWGNDGMTFRAYVATKAMQSLIVNNPTNLGPRALAEDAVAFADALIAELGE